MSAKVEGGASGAPHVTVIDMGKQKRKRVKRLRRGEGRLMEDVQTAISDLRANGTIGSNAEAVVIVVERKPRQLNGFNLMN